jgi:hypothetical protein
LLFALSQWILRVSGCANTPSWVYRRRLTGRLWITTSCLTAAPLIMDPFIVSSAHPDTSQVARRLASHLTAGTLQTSTHSSHSPRRTSSVNWWSLRTPPTVPCSPTNRTSTCTRRRGTRWTFAIGTARSSSRWRRIQKSAPQRLTSRSPGLSDAAGYRGGSIWCDEHTNRCGGVAHGSTHAHKVAGGPPG